MDDRVHQLTCDIFGATAYSVYYFVCYPTHSPKSLDIALFSYLLWGVRLTGLEYKRLGAIYSIRDKMYHPFSRPFSILAIQLVGENAVFFILPSLGRTRLIRLPKHM